MSIPAVGFRQSGPEPVRVRGQGEVVDVPESLFPQLVQVVRVKGEQHRVAGSGVGIVKEDEMGVVHEPGGQGQSQIVQQPGQLGPRGPGRSG